MLVKKLSLTLSAISLTLLSSQITLADTYNIDPTHSFIDFKIQHLGFSWLKGRFNDISGTFNYEAKSPEKSTIDILVKNGQHRFQSC